ncbi:hypothetical protein HYU13_00790 [Candidatus Woesearchaeota archaeon]|nr:hypothetical protein [Candidatus Woesearchaeota archaeon]
MSLNDRMDDVDKTLLNDLRKYSPAISQMRREREEKEREVSQYLHKAWEVVKGVLDDILGSKDVLEVVKLFGKPLPLLAGDEIGGEKWNSYSIGPDGKLYRTHNIRSSQSDPTVLSSTDAARQYVEESNFARLFKDRGEKLDLGGLKSLLESEIIQNYSQYAYEIADEINQAKAKASLHKT